MTREEAKYASKDYVNYLLDKQEYHNEKYTEYDIKQAFEKGAKWADEHPNLDSLWHDASEEPSKACPIMIEIDDDIDPTYDVITVDGKDEKFWKFLASDRDITRWAYIDDLLPKGGEK